VLAIIEAPNEEAMVKAQLTAAQMGARDTETLWAFFVAEAANLIKGLQ